MALQIHNEIYDKLQNFISNNKIPNIIFHGRNGSGKQTIVNKFIDMIYQGNKTTIKNYTMYVNCAHGKGIKFVREELKLFAKINLGSNSNKFKSIVLLNADKLTTDAQSALRRCIELFTHTTRFFIIVEDKYGLLKPILSRFCEIYVPLPIINSVETNLHRYTNSNLFNLKDMKNARMTWLKKTLQTQETKLTEYSAITLTEKLYSKGYSGLDLVEYINLYFPMDLRKYELLTFFNKIKTEFRNEKLIILTMLNFMFIRSNGSLENISFM